ncbi:hypothetical protein CIB48_g12212 [Xylaria polymorpha]|nr:hypothetical protein CIB48_g12212 [Xylaria polymorpha]
MTEVSYRKAQAKDLVQLAEIYNYAIRETAATFDTEEKTADYFQKFVPGDHLCRMLVAVAADNQVVGYAGTYPFSQRKAYSQLAEMMVYIHPQWQRRGVGRGLMDQLHKDGFLDGLFTLLALVNKESVHMHRMLADLGYDRKGEMTDVALKFGRRHSLVIYQGLVESTTKRSQEKL